MNNFAQWYFIMGLITAIIGGYRSWRYDIEQDELTGLSWFLVWWVYLPYFIIRTGYLKMKDYENK